MSTSYSEHDTALFRVRAAVEAARAEFNAARDELSQACKIVPDIGPATDDGMLLWERAQRRYGQAEQAYGDALKQFAAVARDLRKL